MAASPGCVGQRLHMGQVGDVAIDPHQNRRVRLAYDTLRLCPPQHESGLDRPGEPRKEPTRPGLDQRHPGFTPDVIDEGVQLVKTVGCSCRVVKPLLPTTGW